MKRWIAIMLAGCLVWVLAACNTNAVADIDPAQTAQKLYQTIAFTDELSPLENDAALRAYGLSADTVEACSVYVGSGATAEEIAVFKAVDENAVKTITDAANARIQDRINAFANYVPGELTKLKAAEVKSRGKYVILCIADDSAKASQEADQILRG